METGAHTRVMIVEDGAEFQEVLRLTLSIESGMQIAHTSTSGEEAVEAFARVAPDLVIVDFRLRGIDGLETAKKMKAQRPDVKIVMVTGSEEDVLTERAQAATILGVIPKSDFSLERLRKLLKQ
ncbi:MAG: response regulator transcription factor [Dehalococcoidia bacterium]